ncbi:MAG: DUF2855 family protein [Acidimicrobiales bacterium]|nr:DUF2855 family protein [Acidimicrobiales bacterium]
MTRVVEVRRSSLGKTQIVTAPTVDLAHGQVRLKINAFGLTANNITYAVFGDAMQYWNFFPAASGSTWGVVPMWGFADVSESRVEGVAVGERFYGYLPMAEDLNVTPARIGSRGFVDSSPHRSSLPSAYNFCVRCSSDSRYSADGEDVQMLLQPLFTTSFLIDDFLADNDFFGATRVIATSASSKTAFGTAHLVQRRSSVKVTGLTSPANTEFTESLGSYDEVLAYDALRGMAQEASVLLDFAGNANVVRAVHEHLGDSLKHSIAIGGTHWDADRPAGQHPGPRQEFFFAPTQVEKRTADWGGAELQLRINDRWAEFVPLAAASLDVRVHHGIEAAETVYHNVLAGTTPGGIANVIRL